MSSKIKYLFIIFLNVIGPNLNPSQINNKNDIFKNSIFL